MMYTIFNYKYGSALKFRIILVIFPLPIDFGSKTTYDHLLLFNLNNFVNFIDSLSMDSPSNDYL